VDSDRFLHYQDHLSRLAWRPDTEQRGKKTEWTKELKKRIKFLISLRVLKKIRLVGSSPDSAKSGPYFQRPILLRFIIILSPYFRLDFQTKILHEYFVSPKFTCSIAENLGKKRVLDTCNIHEYGTTKKPTDLRISFFFFLTT
jgi:hypothetical protein